MTFSSEVRTLLDDEIFGAEVETVTYSELSSGVVSQEEINKLYYDRRVNFFQCLIRSFEQFEATQQLKQTFLITVRYYLQIGNNDSAYTDTNNRMEEIRELFRENLGVQWGDFIDYYEPQKSPPEIVEVSIGGERCWRGTETYTAYKTISI